jgi:hypothetical protein
LSTLVANTLAMRQNVDCLIADRQNVDFQIVDITNLT